jgi:hypothetical protein
MVVEDAPNIAHVAQVSSDSSDSETGGGKMKIVSR